MYTNSKHEFNLSNAIRVAILSKADKNGLSKASFETKRLDVNTELLDTIFYNYNLDEVQII